MQDPAAAFQSLKPPFQEEEHLKCPRCDSTNTKFCYYNNYNLSQPRHFCKNCRRYWTKGGALRNIPVGGGSRKNKRSSTTSKRSASSTSLAASSSSSSSSSISLQQPKSEPSAAAAVFSPPAAFDEADHRMLDTAGSFSSLLASGGQFENLLDTMNSNPCSGQRAQFGEYSDPSSSMMEESSSNPENFLGLLNDSSCWGGGGGNGWPDLAIYTPALSLPVLIYVEASSALCYPMLGTALVPGFTGLGCVFAACELCASI
ncbi:hypothetical protein ACLOJK_019906 [Asimina triloba]